MLPLCKPGHILLAVRDEREPKEGDVVLIHHGGLEKVKRLTYMKEGRVYVEGDNQTRSTDSRSFGWLHQSAITARVVWPRPLSASQWLRGSLAGVGLTIVLVCAWLFSL